MKYSTVATRGTDFCIRDTFVASCRSGEMLHIRESLLGVMRPSRCTSASGNEPHMGCYGNVTRKVQEKCEGKSYCEFGVFNMVGGDTTCPSNVMQYLNVWHMCAAGKTHIIFSFCHKFPSECKFDRAKKKVQNGEILGSLCQSFVARDLIFLAK